MRSTRSGQSRTGPGALLAILAAAALLAAPAAPADAVTHLNRGDDAPALDLPDLDGGKVRLDGLKERTVVLVFGEVFHERTVAACHQVDKVLADKRLKGVAVTPLLVVTQDIEADKLKASAAKAGISWRILHDVKREAFGAYRVAVLPSAVVIDPAGKVVLPLAGLTTRFSDLLTDGVLLSAGKLSVEQFEKSLHPTPTTAPSEEQVRAERITKLADQLARRGLEKLAAEKYAEAIKIRPTHAPAHLGLGMLQLKQRRLAEAEIQFRAVLETDAKSVKASLGLAYIQTLRGGEELAEATRRVQGVLALHPAEPRAHYLMGLIHEKENKLAEAAASFKKAAELLLERSD